MRSGQSTNKKQKWCRWSTHYKKGKFGTTVHSSTARSSTSKVITLMHSLSFLEVSILSTIFKFIAMQNQLPPLSFRPRSASSATTVSNHSFVGDEFTESCFWKHCQVDTRGTSQEVANFYMRSHLRTSHDNCQSRLQYLDCNPFYLLEEYCGVSLGRDVERMLAVKAEQVGNLLALVD